MPRSLSTVVYHAARLSLDLREPAWTTDGEILNADRVALSEMRETRDAAKFVHLQHDPRLFARLTAFLDDAVQLEGCAYKDVVNPFVAAEWVQARQIGVLKVRRGIPDVALSMRTRGWMYPCRLARETSDTDQALVAGLVQAWRTIDAVPGETIDYDALVEDDSLLQQTLRRLYPDEHVRRAHFVDNTFAANRGAILRRRESEQYRQMASVLASLMAAPMP